MRVQNLNVFFTVDELRLLYSMAPDCKFSGSRLPGIKMDKKWITFLSCSNETGSEGLSILTIVHTQELSCFNGKCTDKLEVYYWITKN